MNHLLIDKMVTNPIKEINIDAENCVYDSSKGYWLQKFTGKALVTCSEFKPSGSKKEDLETGEDKKGE